MLSASMIGSRANHCCDLVILIPRSTASVITSYSRTGLPGPRVGNTGPRGAPGPRPDPTLHIQHEPFMYPYRQRTLQRTVPWPSCVLRLRTTATPRTGGFLTPIGGQTPGCNALRKHVSDGRRQRGLRSTVDGPLRRPFLATGCCSDMQSLARRLACGSIRTGINQIGPRAPHPLDSSASPPLAMTPCALSDFLVGTGLESSLAVCVCRSPAARRLDGWVCV